MLAITLQGLLLGLGAGLAPGPLLALVMTESLRAGTAAGIRVAIAPLLTDTPIVALTWSLAGSLDAESPWLAALSLAGAVVVAHLALAQWRFALPVPDSTQITGALRRGVAVNLLSPHPWLFWTTVGGPLLVSASNRSFWLAVAFLFAFYSLLVGTKVALALLTAQWGRSLTGVAYRRVCRTLGVVLLVFAAHLGWEGVRSLAGI